MNLRDLVCTLVSAVVVSTASAGDLACPPQLVFESDVLQESFGDIAFTKDERHFVYRASSSDLSRRGLFLQSIGGGQRQRLSEEGISAGSFEFSPDGETLVFEESGSRLAPEGVYSVQLSDGQNVKIADRFPAGTVFRDSRFSPDGERLIVFSDRDTLNVTEMFSVDIATGEAIKVNAPLKPDASVSSEFELTPDDQFLIYKPEIPGSSRGDALFLSPLDASAPAQIIDGTDDYEIETFQVGRDNETLLFTATDFNNLFDPTLFAVPLGGGAPFSLGNTRLLNRSYSVAEDGWIVFRTEVNNRQQIFTVAPGETTPVRVNGTLLSGDVDTYLEFGEQVVYVADEEPGAENEAYVVNRDGTGRVRISVDRAAGRGVARLALNPNGTHIVYRMWRENGRQNDIYSVPVTGGPSVLLSGEQVSDADFSNYVVVERGTPFTFSADGSTLFYVVGYTRGGSQLRDFSLYSVAVEGGPSTLIYGEPRALPVPPVEVADIVSNDVTVISDSGAIVIVRRETYPADDFQSRTQSLLVASTDPTQCDIPAPGVVFADGFE